MAYTASAAIDRIKLKAWVGSSGSLTEPQLLELLNDSMRSYVVPFTKSLRDEWWVGRENIEVVTDASSQVTLPNSVASTLRTVAWVNSGVLTPLVRIEPEAAFAYQPAGGGIPAGFMLRGYTLQVLPTIPSITLSLTCMLRPGEMVLEEDAGEIESHASLALTLADVPLTWQTAAPSYVDVIGSESPFSPVAESVGVVSLVGNVLTLTGIDAALIEDGFWVADPGCTPFPNIPIELHPLLELDVMRTLYEGLGDKRLDGISKRQQKMEFELHKTMAPRTQGQSRPILNLTAPGMRYGRWWYGS